MLSENSVSFDSLRKVFLRYSVTQKNELYCFLYAEDHQKFSFFIIPFLFKHVQQLSAYKQ